jgi:pimeloyl-ACP methyl ester carboxylesterase
MTVSAGIDELSDELSDAALAGSLDGSFTSAVTEVGGVRLHHVSGGTGDPLILLPGWPQTWWAYRQLMPALAEQRRVIAVDLRGMGGSGKPADGYDKKTMAADVAGLIAALGYERADVVGHDIGSMVAFSLAANSPGSVGKLVMLDAPHPEEGWYGFSMIPRPAQMFFPWWVAFNCAAGVSEKLLTGRPRPALDYMYDYGLMQPAAITGRDRDVYERAYTSAEANAAVTGWFSTFSQDIEDFRAYPQVATPILALAGGGDTEFMRGGLEGVATDFQVVEVTGAGRYLAEEQPETVLRLVTEFLG